MQSLRGTTIALFFLVCIPSGMDAQKNSTVSVLSSAPGEETHSLEAISLTDVLKRVLTVDPELAVSEGEIRAVAARVAQAGFRPNPELSTEIENFAGTGDMGWMHSSETTIQITMPWETASKRRLRVQKALREKEHAEGEYEVCRSEVITQTVQAFVEVLTCQERLQNRKELFLFAEKIDHTVQERVSAGKVSPIEASRSLVALQSAQLEREKAEKALDAAKDFLAFFWNGSRNDFHRVEGLFRLPPKSLRGTVDKTDFSSNPHIRLSVLKKEVEKSNLSQEIAAAKPDIQLSAGYRRLNSPGDSALVAGVSLPLPLFDRRRGAIMEAQRRVEKAGLERAALENSLQSQIVQQRHAAENAYREATTLTDSILPAAQNALNLLEEGYRQGKFDFLSVLDAQRTYTELKGKHVEAVATAMRAVIDVQSLTGEIMTPNALRYLTPDKETGHDQNP
jgi:outer membrane protein, heavy metal efflux system